jgi:NADH-quinone oxidoreductase subunit N
VSAPLDLRPLFPALIVALTGVVLLLARGFAPRGQKRGSPELALLGLVTALAAVGILAAGPGRGAELGGSLLADDFALFLQGVILVIGIVVVLQSPSYLAATGEDYAEYYSLLLFSIVGMLGLVSAVELISLFVALEIMSVALYALAGMRRGQRESQEAAAKYFLTGAFSSSFFLYGIALIYGASGSTFLRTVGRSLGEAHASPLAVLGAVLVLVGFGFKVGSVPFHMWVPDVYEGAPTTVTGFMAAGVKTAAFGALLRVLGNALPGLAHTTHTLIAILAAATMIFGNLGALSQSNIKRMLAYSSIAHAGYLLTGLVADPRRGGPAVLFYLVAYSAVNLGAFGVLAALSRSGSEPLSLNDISGLGVKRPAAAACLTLFLISLAGVPISAGFAGKFYLFGAAVGAGYASLAVLGMVMSVVSAYYYLRVVVYMYMREVPEDDPWARVSWGSALALGTCALVVLGFGLFPDRLLGLATLAFR